MPVYILVIKSIVMYRNFIQLVIRDKENVAIKPFNKKYNPKAFNVHKEEVKDGSFNPTDELRIETFIFATTILHECWLQSNKSVEELYKRLDARGYDIAASLIGFLNHNSIVALRKYRGNVSRNVPKGSYDIADMGKYKLEATDPSLGMVPADAALEGTTDSVSYLLDYMRYDMDTFFTSDAINKDEYSTAIRDATTSVSYLISLKQVYDNMLYDEGYCEYDIESKRLTFKSLNDRGQCMQHAGKIVMQSKIFHDQTRNPNKPVDFFSYLGNKRIKRYTIVDGVVKLEFGSGRAEAYEMHFRQMQATIDAYYEYIDFADLPDYKNINLKDILAVRVTLAYIAGYLCENYKFGIGTIYTQEEMNELPVRFNKQELVDYIDRLCTVGRKLIRQILPMFVYNSAIDKSQHNDIWIRPIQETPTDYLMAFFPMEQAMTYHIIDSILESGGYDMKKRGTNLEQYIYKQINNNKQKFPVTILPARKYGAMKEEIDVIVGLKDVVVVADAKCIKYPMEAQGYHDNWQEVLMGGCEQVLRKKEYVKNNPEVFIQLGDYSRKAFCPLVITNFPIFTGYEYKGVYVIDAHSFIEYINHGAVLSRVVSTMGNMPFAMSRIYKTEMEMSANLFDYVMRNPLKEHYMKRIAMTEHKICELAAGIKVYNTLPEFQNDPRFNITAN